ncbi:MAG: hypothetical protein V4530_08070 [Pseudomonadota bacterium]
MVRTYLHQLIRWAPLGLSGAYVAGFGMVSGAAQSNAAAKAFIDNQVVMLRAISNSPYLTWWAVGLAAAWLGSVWGTSESSAQSVQRRLYLTGGKEPEGDRLTEYITGWSPVRYFWMPFSDYWSWSRTADHDVHRQVQIAWDLFNPGPDDLLHVRISWGLRGVDPVAAINKSGLFSGALDSLSPRRVTICRDGIGGSHFDLATGGEVTLPIVKADTTTTIALPKALNNAFAIACLATAKEIARQPVRDFKGIKGVMEQMRNDTRPSPDIHISIQYETAQGRSGKCKFLVQGFVAGRVGMHRPVEGKERCYEHEPHSVGAWIRLFETVPQ